MRIAFQGSANVQSPGPYGVSVDIDPSSQVRMVAMLLLLMNIKWKALRWKGILIDCILVYLTTLFKLQWCNVE
jgi:hypothetical protein